MYSYTLPPKGEMNCQFSPIGENILFSHLTASSFLCLASVLCWCSSAHLAAVADSISPDLRPAVTSLHSLLDSNRSLIGFLEIEQIHAKMVHPLLELDLQVKRITLQILEASLLSGIRLVN